MVHSKLIKRGERETQDFLRVVVSNAPKRGAQCFLGLGQRVVGGRSEGSLWVLLGSGWHWLGWILNGSGS